MVDWKEVVLNELRSLKYKYKGVENAKEKIKELDEKLKSLPSALSGLENKTKTKNFSDKTLSLLAEKDELESNVRTTQKELERFIKAIELLDEEGQDILTRLYVRGTNVIQTANDLNVDPSHLYKRRAQAIKKLALLLYAKE